MGVDPKHNPVPVTVPAVPTLPDGCEGCQYVDGFMRAELEAEVVELVESLEYHHVYPYVLRGLQPEERLSPQDSAPKWEFAIRNAEFAVHARTVRVGAV